MNYSEEQIQKALYRYEKHKDCCKKYMKRRYHEDDTYRNKCKQVSKDWYENNKDTRKAYYNKVKARLLAERRWDYAQKTNQIERYMKKYPNDFDLYIIPRLSQEVNISDNNNETETVTED